MGRGGRSNIKGKNAAPKKHIYHQYTYYFKNDVIAFLAAHDIQRTRENFFSQLSDRAWKSKRYVVYKWAKQSTLIVSSAANSRTAFHSQNRKMGTGTVLTEETEARIVKWVNEVRVCGVPMSASMLCIKTTEEAHDQGVPKGKFSASPTWMQSFLGLSFRCRSRSSQASPDADGEIAQQFASDVRAEMKALQISTVYNADQTAVYFEMLLKKTVDARGSRTVWVKCSKKEKERATAMLRADSDGNKFTVFMVFKVAESKIPEKQKENVEKRHGFGKNLWEEAKRIQRDHGIQAYANKVGWWNADLTVKWLRFHFGDRNHLSQPVLVLLDSFSGHWTTEVKEAAASMNVILKAVPKKQTWRCQPADVAWMKPMKDKLRRKWVENLRCQLQQHAAVSTASPVTPFVLTVPTRRDLGGWMASCWSQLSVRTIRNGFIKCGYIDKTPLDEVEAGDDLSATTQVVQALQALNLTDCLVGEVADTMNIIPDGSDVVSTLTTSTRYPQTSFRQS